MAFENAANAVIFDQDRIRCLAASSPEVPIHGERVAIHVQECYKFVAVIGPISFLALKDDPPR